MPAHQSYPSHGRRRWGALFVVVVSALSAIAIRRRRLRRVAMTRHPVAADAGVAAAAAGDEGAERPRKERARAEQGGAGRKQSQPLRRRRQQQKKNKTQQKPRRRQDGASAGAKAAAAKAAAASEFAFRPIGHVRSCFPGCRGVPRQGALAPLTRAKLVLCPEVQPCALDGVDGWSHLWITFVFHRNRRTGKRAGSNGMPSVKFKIEPPKYGRKVGVFATRSPHRVNPIGQTIARVHRIHGRTLELRGVDLVDGTPVLDIKPYVPAYESIPGASMAPWVSNAYDAQRLRVDFSAGAVSDLQVRLGSMRHFAHAEEAAASICEVLGLDIRDGGARSNSRRRGELVDTVGQCFCLDFDGLKLTVRVESDDGSQLQVVRVRRIGERSDNACVADNGASDHVSSGGVIGGAGGSGDDTATDAAP